MKADAPVPQMGTGAGRVGVRRFTVVPYRVTAATSGLDDLWGARHITSDSCLATEPPSAD